MSPQTSARFDRKWRACYWSVIALGSLLLILFPVWRGRAYRFTDSSPGYESRWVKSGSFGLSEVNASTNQAPIWAPPKAAGISFVRWPWEPFAPHVVEIELFVEMTLLCGLVAGCGIALRLVYRLGGRSPDRFVWLAWSTAVGLMLTGAAAWFALLLTLGMLIEEYENWLVVGMVIGGPIGWWYGNVSQRRMPATSDDGVHEPSPRRDRP